LGSFCLAVALGTVLGSTAGTFIFVILFIFCLGMTIYGSNRLQRPD
jgi:hypothetical protein